jgi:hypothetical protein
VNNAQLNLFSNTIQFNGTQTNLNAADGVFIRVGTDAYLAADIQNNTISGNVGNDLHIESFVQYNPFTGVAFQPQKSTAVAAPGLDSVNLDHTAQLDLRLIGNVGNTINIQSPLVNFGQGAGYVPLPGNTTPNGAVVSGVGGIDPLKDNFSFADPSARLVQLFEIDNGPGVNSSNNFSQNGLTQDLINGPEGFIQADWHVRAAADPIFPNPAFPLQFIDSPGNPFLP